MPAGLEKIVKELQAKGYNTRSSWAIAQTIWKKKQNKRKNKN